MLRMWCNVPLPVPESGKGVPEKMQPGTAVCPAHKPQGNNRNNQIKGVAPITASMHQSIIEVYHETEIASPYADSPYCRRTAC